MGESTNACATLRFWSLGVAPAHGAGGRLGALVDPRCESNCLPAEPPPVPRRYHNPPHGPGASPCWGWKAAAGQPLSLPVDVALTLQRVAILEVYRAGGGGSDQGGNPPRRAAGRGRTWRKGCRGPATWRNMVKARYHGSTGLRLPSGSSSMSKGDVGLQESVSSGGVLPVLPVAVPS